MQLEAALRKCLEDLESAFAVLKTQAEQDDLTKLLRRNSFLSRLNSILSAANHDQSAVHVLMMDLDHFKQINDQFGHQTGDEVLERVSQLVRAYLRPSDLAGRYGGEELIVAVQCERQVALEIAERIRQALEHSVFMAARLHAQNNGSLPPRREQFQVTVSLGVASSTDFGYDADRLIAEADRVLFEAKRSGRNKVVVAQAA